MSDQALTILLAILSYALIAIALTSLGLLLFSGRLGEKELTLGPTRDLGLPPRLYLVGIVGTLRRTQARRHSGGAQDALAMNVLTGIETGHRAVHPARADHRHLVREIDEPFEDGWLTGHVRQRQTGPE